MSAILKVQQEMLLAQGRKSGVFPAEVKRKEVLDEDGIAGDARPETRMSISFCFIRRAKHLMKS